MYKSSKSLAFTALISIVYGFAFPQYAFSGIILSDLSQSDLSEVEQYRIELIDPDGLATVGGHALIQSAYPDTPVVARTQWVLTTAYSSTPDQTDSTPFITAQGTYVRDGIVAANFLSFGTRVRFPQIYGDKIFIVEDRMAKRNSHKIDIWMSSRQQALEFGARTVKVEILQN